MIFFHLAMGNEHGSENVSTHPLAQNQSVIFRMFNILWSLGFCYNTCSCKPDKIIYCKDQNAFLNGFLNRNHCKSSKDQTNIWHLLLEREKQLVRQLDIAYERKFQISAECDHDLVYFLGDNFTFSKTWSATSRAIPTYRKNQGRYLHRSTMPFLTNQDKLASLGWPITDGIAHEMGTSAVPALDPKRCDVMVGNSMHLSVASIVLLVGATCYGSKQKLS